MLVEKKVSFEKTKSDMPSKMAVAMDTKMTMVVIADGLFARRPIDMGHLGAGVFDVGDEAVHECASWRVY